MPRLLNSDVHSVLKLREALRGNNEQKQSETSFFPFLLFLVSRISLWRFWGKILGIGRARHPGPGSNNLDVEVFNIGGSLTHGDYALETDADFFAVVEHRLVPARARSEAERLKRAGVWSFWAPASRDSGPVGHAGVGVVSLRGASLSLPTLATAAFSFFFSQGRALWCHLPVDKGRVVHLVVIYGFQGASTDPEELRLTEKLLDAVLCELAVVASGQPCLLAEDLSVKPSRVPSLQKGMMAGHWFNLQASSAAAAGLDPDPNCEQAFCASGGSRRDFFLGCPLASAALGWCRVLEDRWVLPHHSVDSSFLMGRWSAKFCQPVSYTVIWPAAWVSALDKTRNSKSADVRRIWEVYDERLEVVHPGFWEEIRAARLAGDVSLAWNVWSFSVEVSLVRAFSLLEALCLLLVYGLVVALPSSRWWRLETLMLESYGMTFLDLMKVSRFICTEMRRFLGSQSRGVDLCVSCLSWMASLDMDFLLLVVWSLLLSGMLWVLLVRVVHTVGLNWLFLLVWASCLCSSYV